jgi:hypothetical protein
MTDCVNESSLLRSINTVSRYNARDIADLTQLYLITLHILRCEFETAPFAQSYANRTQSAGNWDHVRIHLNDLYQLLNIVISQSQTWTNQLRNQPASRTLLDDVNLNQADVIKFLRNIRGGNFDLNLSGRLLFKFERQLRIQTQNYRSMRRIAQDWQRAHVDVEAKQLVVTRMLQALRHRAMRGDLIMPLQKLAMVHQLEIKDACDPETGKGCDQPNMTKSPSLIKQLAVGAGLGVGAYLLGRALFKGDRP